MREHIVEELITYNGTQLSSLWGYRSFGVQGDSIISFRGPCRVELSEMVDIEDVLKKSPIFSTDMLHFIIEHFDLDLEKTVTRQRLLIAIIKDILEKETGCKLTRKGDDLYYGEGKLSVSIATLTPVSTMIHTGLNVSSKDTPVPAAGLIDLEVPQEKVIIIGRSICRAYAEEIKDIKMARCKVRGVN